jgi:hypothetical protein
LCCKQETIPIVILRLHRSHEKRGKHYIVNLPCY